MAKLTGEITQKLLSAANELDSKASQVKFAVKKKLNVL
jgi:hypothetical protein